MTSALSAGGLAFQRHLDEQVAVHVGVKGGSCPQPASPSDSTVTVWLAPAICRTRLRLVPTEERISTFWLNGAKPLAETLDPVGIEGDVGKAELAGGVGGRGAVESADCVGEVDSRVGNDGAGWIGDGAVHGAGVTALRGCETSEAPRRPEARRGRMRSVAPRWNGMERSPEQWLRNARKQAAGRTAAASSVHLRSIGPLQISL